MKVSVIIPVWNVAPFLARCVQSVCQQTHQDLDILLIDDGSTDGSALLCDTLSQGDQRIRVAHQSNQGASSARNAGLDIATGDYVQFVDGDDVLELNAIEILLKTIVKDHAEIVICGHRRLNYNADGTIVNDLPQKSDLAGCFTRKTFLNQFSQCDTLKYMGWLYCWDKMFLRAFLMQYKLRFPIGMTVCEDRIFNIQCFSVINTISFISNHLYCYSVPIPHISFRSSSMGVDETRWKSHQESFDQLSLLLSTNGCLTEGARKALQHDYFNTMVVAIYRICRTDNRAHLWDRIKLIKKISHHPMMREAIQTYRPKPPRESRAMPLLIRFTNAFTVTLFATWKARRIYG
jgi:glycosyltransferase involved in cell wall biosynthesis